MSIAVWLKIAKQIAKSKVGEVVRRWAAQKSANELRRRADEKSKLDVDSDISV